MEGSGTIQTSTLTITTPAPATLKGKKKTHQKPPSPDNFDEAVLACEVQRGALEVAASVHLRAVLDELVNDVPVSAIAGEVQGRETVAVCLVGIAPPVEVQPVVAMQKRRAKYGVRRIKPDVLCGTTGRTCKDLWDLSINPQTVFTFPSRVGRTACAINCSNQR